MQDITINEELRVHCVVREIGGKHILNSVEIDVTGYYYDILRIMNEKQKEELRQKYIELETGFLQYIEIDLELEVEFDQDGFIHSVDLNANDIYSFITTGREARIIDQAEEDYIANCKDIGIKPRRRHER